MSAMQQNLTHDDVVTLLKKKQGKRQAAELAKELGVSPQYLSDIYLKKCNVGPAILKKLGLRKAVAYSPARARKAAGGTKPGGSAAQLES